MENMLRRDFYERELPERFQDDHVLHYFRSRFASREDYIRQCPPRRRNIIELELERIARSRLRFDQNKKNTTFVKSLDRSRRVWRKQAKDKCSIEMFRCKAELQRIRGLEGDASSSAMSERAAKLSYDLDVLGAVATWEELADSSVHTREDASDAESRYGIEVQKITLERAPETHVARPSDYLGSYVHFNQLGYPLHQVLYEGNHNPIMEECGKNRIRYFHFPANNMAWVEETIGRYYREQRGEYNYRRAANYRMKSSNLLHREIWTGKLYGGKNDPIHARHMRSSCTFVSPDNDPQNPMATGGSRNFILYMPYLHWETDQRRRKLARIIFEQRSKIKKELRPGLASAMPVTALGDYLLHVAMAYEAIDVEADVELLRQNLSGSNPLHPRRTLDQAFNSKLSDTSSRDESQVVYRGTRTGSDIRRTTRVVMVDQLWLYILDDQTIFTFFPKRWGRNHPDRSCVYERIVSKLYRLRPGDIHSVYDLAFIIINQCSTVFFDHTSLADERPDVLDIFDNAIAKLSNNTTGYFDSISPSQFQSTKRRSGQGVGMEWMLLTEAHDITEEIRMLTRVFADQLRVMNVFYKTLRELYETEGQSRDPRGARGPRGPFGERIDELSMTSLNTEATRDRAHNEMERSSFQMSSVFRSTLRKASNLIASIETRIDELATLEANTKEITDYLGDFINLKTQHVSIIEAALSRELANESVTQGRSIMLFTVITLIFLPLSFMSSLFGMNARELSGPEGGVMSLGYQFKYMFSISAGVIAISLGLAFSAWTRSLISLVFTVPLVAFIQFSGLAHLWAKCSGSSSTVKLATMEREILSRLHRELSRKFDEKKRSRRRRGTMV